MFIFIGSVDELKALTDAGLSIPVIQSGEREAATPMVKLYNPAPAPQELPKAPAPQESNIIAAEEIDDMFKDIGIDLDITSTGEEDDDSPF